MERWQSYALHRMQGCKLRESSRRAGYKGGGPSMRAYDTEEAAKELLRDGEDLGRLVKVLGLRISTLKREIESLERELHRASIKYDAIGVLQAM